MVPLNSSLRASLVTGVQETNVGLINLNYDFSLFKVEAPAEYQGLGSVLSKRRREVAEKGSEHIFARKLGALFSQLLPSTPRLYSAYGLRATEIAQSLASGSHGSRDIGPFQDWVGPDATSIWAAATSGSGAIAVHLLACMLARLWSASEATAIWEELIEGRKQELSMMDPAEPLLQATLAAARIEVTREQMSSWDASARAWLGVADDVKKLEQTQLMLLIKDSGLPVNGTSNVYASVMDAWKTALTTVENIIIGMPQSIRDGAALLGLASWHIYPDMCILGASSINVPMNDPLVATGGIVTLGLISCSPDAEQGSYWSLPLAYLRFYGDPVQSSRTIGEVSTRLTFSELFLVIFGAVVAGWSHHGADLPRAANLVMAFGDFVDKTRSERWAGPRSWLSLLAEAAERYLSSKGSQRDCYHGLVLRGSIDAEPGSLLIRCRNNDPGSDLDWEYAKSNYTESGSDPTSHLSWEYVTATKNTKKRKLDSSMEDLSGHIRWTSRQPNTMTKHHGESFEAITSVDAHDFSSHEFSWSLKSDTMPQPNAMTFDSSEPEDLFYYDTSQFNRHTETPRSQRDYYRCLIGNPAKAALFAKFDSVATISQEFSPIVLQRALDARWIEREKLVSHFDNMRGQNTTSKATTYVAALQALAAAAHVYQLMPGATITTSIFSKPFRDTKWASRCSRSAPYEYLVPGALLDAMMPPTYPSPQTQQDPAEYNEVYQTELSTYMMTRAETFACIAMFENRDVNLNPSSLDQVLALSAGNSIYVAMPLICDPFDCPLEHEVKHVVGNIGKPGISLLIPPPSPKIRKVDETVWNQVNHAPFDGNLEDSFKHTSLHLTFTRYKIPISINSHGDQAVEASFIQTLVSVFDRDEWVADLDVLKALRSPNLVRINKHYGESHASGGDPPLQLTSIDLWHEYLDPPLEAAIFRANNNWHARLAVAVLNAQCGVKTLLFRNKDAVCWHCCQWLAQYEEKPFFVC